MYKLEKSKKDVLMPHLAYHLLEMYAGGFEYRKNQQAISFARAETEEQKQRSRSYILWCRPNPFLEEPARLRKALLIQEEGEVRCRAGGLSITMLAEMVMVVYYAHFAQGYDEEKPQTKAQYQSELDNMKDYILRLFKKDKGIRCVPRSIEYFGYYRIGNNERCLPCFNIESDPAQEPQMEELILDGGKTVLLDCFGRSKSSQYRSYQLMDNENKNSETLLMLDRLYEENSCGELVLKENHAQDWPKELLEEKIFFSDTARLGNSEGWFCFGELLNLQNRGMVYIRPAYSANKNRGIAMIQGRYVLAWHQTKDGVDSIVLTIADNIFLKNFESLKKKLPGKDEEQKIVPMNGVWLTLIRKKMEQAEKSQDKFEFKRKATKEETKAGRRKDFKVLRSLSWDLDDTRNQESCVLKSKKSDETEGFLLTDLLPRDFWGYRHIENGLRPDMLVFWTNPSEKKESKPEVLGEKE